MDAYSCDKVRANLSAYVDGALSKPERAQMEKHLQACGSGCREEAASLRAMLAQLKASPLPEEPNLWPGIRRKLDAQARQPARKPWFGLDFSPLHGLALAATAVLIVVVVNLPRLSRDELALQHVAGLKLSEAAPQRKALSPTNLVANSIPAAPVSLGSEGYRPPPMAAAPLSESEMDFLNANAARVQEQFDKKVDTTALKREFGQGAVVVMGGDGAAQRMDSGTAVTAYSPAAAQPRSRDEAQFLGGLARSSALGDAGHGAGSSGSDLPYPSEQPVDFVWNTPDKAAARLSLGRWAAENHILPESDEARQDKDAAPAVVFRLNPEQLASLFQAFPQLQPQALSSPNRSSSLVRIRIQPAP